jgi:DNA repair protein RecN (Recombination protein N)
MFVGLSIRNVVLIEQLSLAFGDGLTVLTGETGAGKSILLDALGLALGARADAGLVRAGAETASVAAEFALPAGHPVRALLRDSDIEASDDTIVLRRTVQADGRSRAHIADQPVSVGLLRQVGSALVEIHGQFDTQGLLDPRTHRGVLDAFAGNAAAVEAVRSAWAVRREREQALEALRRSAATAAGEAELLRHAVEELERLAPEPDEEARLAERRALLQQAGRLIEAIGTALGDLGGDRGAEHGLASAQRTLYRMADRAQGRFDAPLEAIGRALDATAEAEQALQRLTTDLDFDSDALERLEDRLFALRAAARKHGVGVDGLAAVAADLAARLSAIEGRDDAIARLEDEVRAAREAWAAAARLLSATRREAASGLDEAVSAELAPLHLGRARFATELAPVEEGGPDGAETVTFTVSTNPDMPPGPLNRIASGGELARFMLALKLVLARRSGRSDAMPAMVFDEVDSGVGGAVAEAVGARLRRLGASVQVFAVTHNPQVAARAHRHLLVEKQAGPVGTASTVVPLDAQGRREEIARMLSGARVTDEARAAADALIAGDG